MHLGPVLPGAQRLLQFRHRLRRLAGIQQGDAQIIVGRNIVRLQAQRPYVRGQRLRQLAGAVIPQTEIVPRRGVVRLQAQGRPVLPLGLGRTVRRREGGAIVVVHLRRVRIGAQPRLEVVQRLGIASAGLQQEPQVVVRHPGGRIAGEGRPIEGFHVTVHPRLAPGQDRQNAEQQRSGDQAQRRRRLLPAKASPAHAGTIKPSEATYCQWSAT